MVPFMALRSADELWKEAEIATRLLEANSLEKRYTLWCNINCGSTDRCTDSRFPSDSASDY